MADKKFVIKGINCIYDNGPKDAYIILRPDIGERTHERSPELNDRVTRFDTFDKAETIAQRQVEQIFERYVIEEADEVITTNTEEGE